MQGITDQYSHSHWGVQWGQSTIFLATACNKSWTATDRCCCFPRMSSWCKRKVCQARVGSASVGPLTRAIRALAPGPTVAVSSFGTWMAKQSSMAAHHRAHQSTQTCACSRASSQSQPSLQPEQRWRRLKMIGSVAPSATAPPASAEHVMAMMAYERAVQQRGASQSETKRSQGLCAHVVPRAAAHVSAVFCVGRHGARVLWPKTDEARTQDPAQRYAQQCGNPQ